VLADNTSAAGVLLGPLKSWGDLDGLAALHCSVTVDGRQVHEATGAAILGNPLLALVWLSEHLAARGEVLPAGSLVLAGALTDAVPLEPRTGYRLEIEGLGAVEVRT
jgi:2-oxo-3-hexenedioate decarboxylase